MAVNSYINTTLATGCRVQIGQLKRVL